MKKRTTARGLGWSHQRTKAKLPDPDGAPCPYCRRPMLPGQFLDADHLFPRVLGGGNVLRWAHRSCNRSEGAKLRNLLEGRSSPRPGRWSDRWS